MERLSSKIAVGRINPREYNTLKKGLEHIPNIIALIQSTEDQLLGRIAEQLNPCEILLDKITNEIKPSPPLVINQGGMIMDGVDTELDELRAISTKGKDYLSDLRIRECERTGIPSLKISYNKVFGYYLEVTKAHQDKVPEEWIRKQTLVNAERYITP